MCARIEAYDWASTPLGPREQWPSSLRSAVGIMLGSRYPMFVWWGPQHVNIYNDAYVPILGPRHPAALGRPASETWSDIWDVVGPQADLVLRNGQATWNEEALLLMERYGYTEETYFTFSYSPAPDDQGRTAGVFAVCTEDTARVLGERRLRTLREVAAAGAEARTADAACGLVAEALAGSAHDLPFALIYLLDPQSQRAQLAGASGIQPGGAASPEVVELEGDSGAAWPLRAVARTHQAEHLTHLTERFGDLPGGPWPEPAQDAVVLPIEHAGQGQVAGFLVAGLSPRRSFDEAYEGFLELLAGNIASAIANARAHEEERKRVEALAELDRAKTQFFSNVSHEFRTPLTLMLGPVEDALASPTRALAGEELEAVHRNTLRLLKLVNTLLEFSRLESGRIRAAYEPVDLARLTAELASVFRAAVERAGVRYVVDTEPLPQPVYVDREMWEKVVFNLLSNAFKFTLAGEIRVEQRAAAGHVELSVTDTGSGIPAEELPYLFERFRRIEGAHGRTHEGTGIGLALVQELVRLHGGAIQVESALGAGTTFTVRLPFGAEHLPAEQLQASASSASSPAAAHYVNEALRWTDAVPLAEAPMPSGNGAAAPAAVSRARVLIADDNADMRDYLQRLLSAQFDVETAPDGEVAVRLAQARRPDLVLADVMMPRLDGFGLLRALRSQPATARVPVIMLSARAGEEARVEGLEAGADDYLVKPFSARELLARVTTHLELARAREEAQTIVESITDAFFAVDREWRFRYVNREGERILHRKAEELLGRSLWDAFPEAVGSTFDHEYHRAVADGTAVHFEEFFPPLDTWYEVHAYPSPDGLSVFFRDINRRRATEAALREADRRKDEFLATLAHELRNPLAPILTATEVLRLRAEDPEAVAGARETIRRQVEHMRHLISDLLDVARITRGMVELQMERVELAAVLSSAVQMAKPLMEARQQTLTVSVPLEPVPLEADPNRLAQVITNLLTNAAKFTPAGGRIQVTAECSGGQVAISVQDSGKGIPAEMLPQIFDLFTQVNPTIDRAEGGLGIGLTLVQRLVQMHGGGVEARSDGPGQGSTFVVRLPALETPKPQVPGRGSIETGAGSLDLGPKTSDLGLRVLAVDDNADAVDTLAELLEIWGYEVRVAYSGDEALARARDFRPDVMLLDIGLPGMDGYELARTLRGDASFHGCHLIAVTGFGQEEDRQRSTDAGFDQHLTKPVDPNDLRAALARIKPR